MTRVKAEELRPGDVVLHDLADVQVRVEILGERQPWEDLFGIERMQYWSRRADTGRQGWFRLGFGARLTLSGE